MSPAFRQAEAAGVPGQQENDTNAGILFYLAIDPQFSAVPLGHMPDDGQAGVAALT